jgi:hypothetical protein
VDVGVAVRRVELGGGKLTESCNKKKLYARLRLLAENSTLQTMLNRQKASRYVVAIVRQSWQCFFGCFETDEANGRRPA